MTNQRGNILHSDFGLIEKDEIAQIIFDVLNNWLTTIAGLSAPSIGVFRFHWV
jgi:hypothetical protein